MKPTRLLDEHGAASMATMIMLSHHAFRRDLARFASAVGHRDPAALREEWTNLCAALHGHHQKEDTDIFPHMRSEHPEMAGILDELSAQHHRIDPLLERGTRAFAELPDPAAARAAVADLLALLDQHLDAEEASVIPHLRTATEFPTPASDEETALYADGFAWALQGIAPQVIDKVMRLLPQNLLERLPAARAAFDARCERVWGTWTRTTSETSVPVHAA